MSLSAWSLAALASSALTCLVGLHYLIDRFFLDRRSQSVATPSNVAGFDDVAIPTTVQEEPGSDAGRLLIAAQAILENPASNLDVTNGISHASGLRLLYVTRTDTGEVSTDVLIGENVGTMVKNRFGSKFWHALREVAQADPSHILVLAEGRDGSLRGLSLPITV